ncbi:hypothetical protein MMC25_006345 [Agyrium rufum]|nr:hypothetical protein [Agyrium rufum]
MDGPSVPTGAAPIMPRSSNISSGMGGVSIADGAQNASSCDPEELAKHASKRAAGDRTTITDVLRRQIHLDAITTAAEEHDHLSVVTKVADEHHHPSVDRHDRLNVVTHDRLNVVIEAFETDEIPSMVMEASEKNDHPSAVMETIENQSDPNVRAPPVGRNVRCQEGKGLQGIFSPDLHPISMPSSRAAPTRNSDGKRQTYTTDKCSPALKICPSSYKQPTTPRFYVSKDGYTSERRFSAPPSYHTQRTSSSSPSSYRTARSHTSTSPNGSNRNPIAEKEVYTGESPSSSPSPHNPTTKPPSPTSAHQFASHPFSYPLPSSSPNRNHTSRGYAGQERYKESHEEERSRRARDGIRGKQQARRGYMDSVHRYDRYTGRGSRPVPAWMGCVLT